jgi:Flp pilus assembly protein TadD
MNVRLGKFTAAVPHLEALTVLSPNDKYAWFYLAVCYTEEKEYEKAADVYENKVLMLDPKNVDVMNNLAYVYREMGNSEKALYWLLRAEEIKKNP